MHRTHPVSLRAVPPPALPRTQRQIPLPGNLLGSAPSRAIAAFVALLAALAAGCSGHHKPATAPLPLAGPSERGMASWYGPKFNGHRTASGERYDMRALTAAHPSLPFGTLVRVTNVENGRQVVVRINDRGPFAKRRVIDLSYTAARELGVVGPGTAEVELAVLGATDATPPAFERNPVVLAALSGTATQPATETAPENAIEAVPENATLPLAPAPTLPEVGASGAVPAQAAAEALRFTVQVGAFAERERADAMQQDLSRTYPQTVVSSDGTWNRVQLGSFDSREQADALCLELAKLGVPAIVVTVQ